MPCPPQIRFYLHQRSAEPPTKPEEPISAKSDLPDWLSDIDEPAEEGKKSVEEEPVIPSPKPTKILDI